MNSVGTKFLVFSKPAQVSTAPKNQSVKILWKLFSGWHELGLNGVNYTRDMASGIAYSVDIMLGQKKIFEISYFSRFDKSARNYASFIAFVGALLWLR